MDNAPGTTAKVPTVQDMQPFSVPGHEVLELLGYGRLGEVWRARRGAELVVLRRLDPTDHEALAEVRKQATLVRTLTSRHLVRLKTVTQVHGDDVLVLDHAARGSLDALLADRGVLAPGEVVTVLAPLAEALGQAHGLGLQHRRLTASRVLFAADGRPLLDGLGLDPLHDPADSLDPTGALGSTADVWALGDLGRRMLGGADDLPATTPLPLREAIEAALDPDPFARPAAQDLAARLLASCPAAPVQGLPEPVVLPAPWPRPAPRRLPRPALVGGAVLGVLAVVVVLGWTWGARGAPATASVGAVPTDWRAVVEQLDAARGRAFTTGVAQELAAVYDRGSPLLGDDERVLLDLRARRLTARGLHHRVLAAEVRVTGPDRVTLAVTQQLAGYTLVDTRGRVQERHTDGPAQRVVMVLTRAPVGWRVALVRAA